jgi:hypothetical protein
MEIDQKTGFCRQFLRLPASLLIVFVIFVLRLIDSNKKCPKVQRNLGERVKLDEIITELTLQANSKHFCAFVANFGTYQ